MQGDCSKAEDRFHAAFSGRGQLAGSRRAEQRQQSHPNDYWDGRVSREAHFAELIRSRYPQAAVQDITRSSTRCAASRAPRDRVDPAGVRDRRPGHAEAIAHSKPGVYEYELDAARATCSWSTARDWRLSLHHRLRYGNIANMHYYRNMSKLDDGQMVLMDYAPEYHYYTSDIGRMWPVNGKFSPWQRELFAVRARIPECGDERIRPG